MEYASRTRRKSHRTRPISESMAAQPTAPGAADGRGSGTDQTAGSGTDQTVVGQALALLFRHLDVGRGEEEYLVGHPFHAARQRIGGSTAEVDHAALQITVGGLHVHDHRLI